MVSGVFRGTIWNETIPNTLRGRLAGIEMISYLTGPLIGNARAGFMADAWGVSRCSTNWELRRTTSATRPESVSL
jgi:hypothetical protein